MQLRNKKKQIGQYWYPLDKIIGKGYSSVVYQGTHMITSNSSLLEQTVAIKVVNRILLKNQIQKKMLQDQLAILQCINHKNLLKCYDILHTSNNTYIITQLCSDGDLHSLLATRNVFYQYEVVKILKDIISGYFQLVRIGYIHRDLKPANLLIKNSIIKIADFGFAKKIDKINDSKQNVGTPFYMSPQSLSQSKYSYKSDIFSIGIIAYQLLYGCTPWKADSQQTLYYAMMNKPVIFHSWLKVSQRMKLFIQKCLRRSDHQRMQIDQLCEWQLYFGMSRQSTSLTVSTAPTQPLIKNINNLLKVRAKIQNQEIKNNILVKKFMENLDFLIENYQKGSDISIIMYKLWESGKYMVRSLAHEDNLKHGVQMIGFYLSIMRMLSQPAVTSFEQLQITQQQCKELIDNGL